MSEQLNSPSFEPDKLVHHLCGYPLWTYVLDRVGFFPEGGTVPLLDTGVVLGYRSAKEGTLDLMVWCCPGCGKPLKIWWSAPFEQN